MPKTGQIFHTAMLSKRPHGLKVHIHKMTSSRVDYGVKDQYGFALYSLLKVGWDVSETNKVGILKWTWNASHLFKQARRYSIENTVTCSRSGRQSRTGSRTSGPAQGGAVRHLYTIRFILPCKSDCQPTGIAHFMTQFIYV